MKSKTIENKTLREISFEFVDMVNIANFSCRPTLYLKARFT